MRDAEFITEAWTLCSVSITFTALRIYGRIKLVGAKKLQPDDYLVLVGLLFNIVETLLSHHISCLTGGLGNNDLTDEERLALLSNPPEYALRVTGSKMQMVGSISHSVVIWPLKASLLVFFKRLTAGLGRSYRIRIYIGFAFVVSSWLVVIMTIFFGCWPIYKNWQIYPNPGNLYLLCIPLPMVWASKLKLPKRIGLVVLFSAGLLVMVCALLRNVLIMGDPQNASPTAKSWAIRESFVAILTTNSPAMVPVFRSLLSPVLSAFNRFRTIPQIPKSPSTWVCKTIGGGGHLSWRGWGPRSVNPIPDITINGFDIGSVGQVTMQDNYLNSVTPADKESSSSIRKDVEFTIRYEEGSEVQSTAGNYVTITSPGKTSGEMSSIN